MLNRPEGNATIVREEQPFNKLLGIAVIPVESVTLVKDEHPENAPDPSDVTLDGMFKLFNPMHP